MTLKAMVVAAVLLSGISGCASYAPRDHGAGGSGFSEKRLSDGAYWLRFDGEAYDGYDKLATFWNQRAAELCGPGNFTGAPSRGAGNGSVMVYSAGVVYPSTYRLSFVEGRVECKDKALAHQLGPKKYNPGDGVQKLAIGSVVVTQAGVKADLSQSLLAFLRSDFDGYSVGTSSAEPEYLLNVDVVRYVADAGGADLLGALSEGTFHATSVVTVVERKTGRVLGRREVSSLVDRGGEKEYNLKKLHSRAIVEYAVSVFWQWGAE